MSNLPFCTTVFQHITLRELCTAEDIAQSLASCGLVGTGASSMHSSHSNANWQHKRHRDISGGVYPSATRPKPLKSMAEVLALANFTNAQIDACRVRCGAGNLVPLRAAVRKMFRGTVANLCGVLPLEVLRRTFEQAIETEDQILFGFTSSKGTVPCYSILFFRDREVHFFFNEPMIERVSQRRFIVIPSTAYLCWYIVQLTSTLTDQTPAPGRLYPPDQTED